MLSYIPYNGETEEQYLWMLGQYKDNGDSEIEWNEIADIMNKIFRKDESDYRTEAAYRKPYQQAKRFYEAGVFSCFDEKEYLNMLEEKKEEIYKEKRKLYDQRREYNKLLVSDARAENLNEKLLESVEKINKEKPLVFNNELFVDNKEKVGMLCFSDWHLGMVTDNIWNTFNVEICKQRVKETVEKALYFIKLNKLSKIHILTLGDLAHGAIHCSCRVASEEDVCDQLMMASELLAEAINEISNCEGVNEVILHSCYGNHMRTIQDKNDSIHSDNMEKIVPWWIKARLNGNEKVTIEESEYKEFTMIEIFGYNIVAVHGDLDKFKNLGVTVNTIFTKKYNKTIDYTISGDKHHLEEFEQFDIDSTLVPSLCGTDEYANNNRLFSNAGQTFIVFNKYWGKESTSVIPLDR